MNNYDLCCLFSIFINLAYNGKFSLRPKTLFICFFSMFLKHCPHHLQPPPVSSLHFNFNMAASFHHFYLFLVDLFISGAFIDWFPRLWAAITQNKPPAKQCFYQGKIAIIGVHKEIKMFCYPSKGGLTCLLSNVAKKVGVPGCISW